MKKFNFNLKALLMIRQQKENAAQQEFAFAQSELKKLLKILDQINEETRAIEDELKKKQKKSLSVAEFRDHLLYIQSLKIKITSYQDEILTSQNIVESKRQAMNTALQNKKVLENIKDKKHEQWKESFAKMEAKLLDELATIRHIREK